MVTGLLALLDDITRILDDVSAITKVAAASRGWKSLVHPWLHRAPGPHVLSEDERTKVRAAVRTDFVLSAEIIVITLGTVADRPLATQIGVMIGIAALMTAGVYGLVAGIVRLDDIGLYLSRFPGGARRWLGRAILAMAPYLMRTLSVVGTAAMFLVGGGILTHGLPGAHEAIDHLTKPAADVSLLGGMLGPVAVLAANGIAGVLAGATALGVQRGVRAVLTALGIGIVRNVARH